MAMFRVLLLLVPLLLSSVCQAQTEAETQATDAAKAWLQLVDEGMYDESWQEAASTFRKNVGKSQWRKMAQGVREPLGALQTRELESAKYTSTLPGAPDGEYVIVQFKTKYANKASAVETLTPMKDTDGVWRVSGYFVR